MAQSNVTYAVIRVGGQQYKVSTGDVIVVDRLRCGRTIGSRHAQNSTTFADASSSRPAVQCERDYFSAVRAAQDGLA